MWQRLRGRPEPTITVKPWRSGKRSARRNPTPPRVISAGIITTIVSRGGSLAESYVATAGYMRSDPVLAVSDTA